MNRWSRSDKNFAHRCRRRNESSGLVFEATAPADALVMFDHVYAELPPELKAQRETLAETLRTGEPGRREKHEPSPPMRGQRTGRR